MSGVYLFFVPRGTWVYWGVAGEAAGAHREHAGGDWELASRDVKLFCVAVSLQGKAGECGVSPSVTMSVYVARRAPSGLKRPKP